MTGDGPRPTTAPGGAVDGASPALREPGTRGGPGLRPPLRVWAWVAVTLSVVIVAGLLWRVSDAAATSSTTAAEAAAPTGTPAGQLSAAWSATSQPAAGVPGPDQVAEGARVLRTVATGVQLLDPLTGEEAWHSQRADARLCDATAVDGLVVAVFRTTGRCNEIVALDAATGGRAWYRTIGFRADVQLSSTDRIVLASTPTGIVTVDPAGNNIRWRYAPPEGCRLTGSGLGTTGVVVLQVCADPAVVQVRLLDGFDGTARWTRDVAVPPGDDATSVRLTGADLLVGVADAASLQVLAPADGAPLLTVPLPAPAGDDTDPLEQTRVGDTALVYARGTVLALAGGDGRLRWQTPARGLPAPDGSADGGTDVVLVPEDDALVTRDAVTGTELARSTVEGGLPVGARTTVLGPVVLLTTPDEVLALR